MPDPTPSLDPAIPRAARFFCKRVAMLHAFLRGVRGRLHTLQGDQPITPASAESHLRLVNDAGVATAEAIAEQERAVASSRALVAALTSGKAPRRRGVVVGIWARFLAAFARHFVAGMLAHMFAKQSIMALRLASALAPTDEGKHADELTRIAEASARIARACGYAGPALPVEPEPDQR